jgi:DNA mismatch endonuclease (patch repair protein)
MSQVKGKNTKPEIKVRKYLHSRGYRYNLHGKYRGSTLSGKPDLVLPSLSAVIFVQGCFWHSHQGCKYAKIPETRRDFWKKKLSQNKERDLRQRNELEQSGWKVIEIWTCEIKTQDKFRLRMRDLIDELNNLKH